MHHLFQKPDIETSIPLPTVFVPGWGFDGRILKLLKPRPFWIYPANQLDPYRFEQDLLKLCTVENFQKIRLIGWSLGAMLALKFAARHSERLDSLILISLRIRWPAAEIDAIREEFSSDPVSFLKDFYRKCFLGDKLSYSTFRDQLQPAYLAEIDQNLVRLEHGLDFLAAFTLPAPLPDLPITLIHGSQDVIAPLAERPNLPGAEIEQLDTAGHVPFLNRNCSLNRELMKQEIMLRFSKAAETYDSFARVQAEVARKLADTLPGTPNNQKAKTILEIGCGTGNFTSMLHARYPNGLITALDFSPDMIDIARRKVDRAEIQFICADGEAYLPQIPKRSLDLVVSNGSLQWFSNLNKTFRTISKILKHKGAMFCSIFGPASLQELGRGLKDLLPLDGLLAARTFPGMAELEQMLADNFLESTVTEELLVKEYESALDLLLHIKNTGTGGWRQNFSMPLTPARLKKLDQWFDKTYGSCRVTYQVFYLQGRNQQ